MQPLVELEDVYLDHQRPVGSSPKTITHYRNTFLIFHRFLESTGQVKEASLLTSAVMNGFAGYLRETPSREIRGNTQRSIVTTHGHLKDKRAFVCYLREEGHLEQVS